MKKRSDISRTEIKDWLTKSANQSPLPQDVMEAEDALIAYVEAHSVAPPVFLRDKIMSKISQLNGQNAQRQKLQLDNLPMLDDNTNWLDWEDVVAGIEAPTDFEDIYLHSIETNDKRELFVAWVKEMVPEEVHYDLLESFLILEGSCECHITNEKGETRIVRLGQGDHITMQLGETHDIIITSLKPAKAILEWRKLAA
ncbi:MAG: hypothetical protein IPM82_07595 [Saprospiraceae bacterium]|nr:hypothetical protein [Saprospiraceae bacterium]